MTSVLLGYGVYRGGVRLDLRRFFLWTGVFVILVAAGLAAGVLRNLHEAGIWNGLQQPVWDLSRAFSETAVAGTVLRGLFGYRDVLVLGELVVWALVLGVSLWFFLRPPAAPATPAARP